MAWGRLHHVQGLVPDLWAGGWLPRRAAAEALGVTVEGLDRLARRGEIRSIAIGPGARLYCVEGNR